MSKVFVVTSGSYSDYGIRAMFSTKKLAQSYIDKALEIKRAENDDYYVGGVYWSDEANIEEWELDAESKSVRYDYWTVGMLLDDGSIVEEARQGAEFGHPRSRVEQLGDKVPCYQNRPIVRVKSIKSAKHAEKMAVEARRAFLRISSPASSNPVNATASDDARKD